MRQTKPLHLSDIDPERAATSLTAAVYYRANRDAPRLGMSLLVPGVEGRVPLAPILNNSQVHKAALVCALWAVAGKGKPEEVAGALLELRADLDGVEPGETLGREPDLSTVAGVVVVAAAARLTLVEGQTVEADEVATLASVDARTIRAAAAAGALPPVGNGRPMRFAADAVCQYLYVRGVPGFGPPAQSRTIDPAAAYTRAPAGSA